MRQVIAKIFLHPVWTGIGVLAAVPCIQVSARARVQPDAETGSGVAVSAISFGDDRTVEAVSYGSWDKTDTMPADKRATPIDITLTNKGSVSVRFTELKATVVSAKSVSCTQQGGGVLVSAEYTIRVPFEPFQSRLTANEVSKDIDFSVKPGSSDRMAVTIGPTEEGNGDPVPIAVKIELKNGSGVALPIGTVAIVQPDSADSQIERLQKYTGLGLADACVQEAEAEMLMMRQASQAQSPAFERLREALPRIL